MVYVQMLYLLTQNEKHKYVHLISNELNLITKNTNGKNSTWKEK